MFEVGSVVYLKSGSPKFTVVSNDDAEKATEVLWVQANGEISREIIPNDCLIAEEPVK